MGESIDRGADGEEQREGHNDANDAGEGRSHRSQSSQSCPVDDEVGDESAQDSEDGGGCADGRGGPVGQYAEDEAWIGSN